MSQTEKKWECGLIQDVLPLYADEVCSESTSRAVQEHLAECESCRELFEQLRQTEFTAARLDADTIDGMKKVKKKLKRQQWAAILLAGLLLLLGINGFHGSRPVSAIAYAALFVVCLAGIYETGTDRTEQKKGSVPDRVLTAGSVAVSLAAVGMFALAVAQITSGSPYVLGAAPESCGPFLAKLWAGCFLLQTGILLTLWRRQKTRGIENRVRACAALTGIFLLLMYVEALRYLDTTAGALERFTGLSVCALLCGVAGAVGMWRLCSRQRTIMKM